MNGRDKKKGKERKGKGGERGFNKYSSTGSLGPTGYINRQGEQIKDQ